MVQCVVYCPRSVNCRAKILSLLDYDIKELGFFFIVEAWAKKQQQRLAHCVKSGRINLVVQYSS